MICPNCQIDSPITEQNYGALYTCNNCQAVYFINFEGQPEYGEVSEEPLQDFTPLQDEAQQDSALDDILNSAAYSAPVSPEVNPFAGVENNNNELGSLEPLVDSVDVVSLENQNSNPFSLETLNSEEASPVADNIDFNSDLNPFENQNNFEQTQPEPSGAAKSTSSNSFANVAQEISSFGNAEVQLAGLNYTLKIAGLDTQEIRRLFQEAIEDSKFGWDANEVLKNIKNGQVEFTRLSPAKAYILAKRLQFIDIEKKWTQNVLA